MRSDKLNCRLTYEQTLKQSIGRGRQGYEVVCPVLRMYTPESWFLLNFPALVCLMQACCRRPWYSRFQANSEQVVFVIFDTFFTHRLQYRSTVAKNTSDIALALNALAALLDHQVDCSAWLRAIPISSDLRLKLCERGASVHIVGEKKDASYITQCK